MERHSIDPEGKTLSYHNSDSKGILCTQDRNEFSYHNTN